MATVVQLLTDFIDLAERNRNYPRNTASGLKAALNRFEPELNEQEKESLDVFEKHLDQIYQNVYLNNKAKMSPVTLETYKKRMKKLIKDYLNYGVDPARMASWTRSANVRQSSPKTKKKTKPKLSEDNPIRFEEKEMTRFELTLRPGVKAIILTPSDITADEVKRVKLYIEFLERSVS